mgnify:CR=1 FL=1
MAVKPKAKLPAQPGRKGTLEYHPRRSELVKHIVLDTKTKVQLAKEYGVTPHTVLRFSKRISEQERVAVLAQHRRETLPADVAEVNEERKDIARTYDKLASRVEALIDKAEQRNDDAFALAAMEGLRKVLRDIATMQGKLAQQIKLDISLNDSREWIELKGILEALCDEVPQAREPLLRLMRERRLSVARHEVPL